MIIDGLSQSTFIGIWPRTEGDTTQIHVWTETRDSRADAATSFGAQPRHSVCDFDGSIVSLHPLSASQLLIQHVDGSLSVVDFGTVQDPRIEHAGTRFSLTPESSPTQARTIHNITVLDRTASTSILRNYPHRPTTALVLVASTPASASVGSKSKLGRKGRKSAIEVIDAAEGHTGATKSAGLQLDLLLVESDARISRLGEAANLSNLLAINDAEHLLSVSLHHSGRVIVLSTTGLLISAMLRVSADAAAIFGNIERLIVSMPAPVDKSGMQHRAEAVILTPSTVLVALPAHSPSTTHAAAILVDVELGSVLAETSWKVSSDGADSLFAHRIGGSTVMVLAAPQSGTNTRNGNVTLYALSYEAGDGNHLRWALASRNVSERWLQSSSSSSSSENIAPDLNSADQGEAPRQALLNELVRLRQSPSTDAGRAMDQAFTNWYKGETERIRDLPSERMPSLHDNGAEASSDSDTAAAPEGHKRNRKNVKTPAKASNGSAGHKALNQSKRPHIPQTFAGRLAKLSLPSPLATAGTEAGGPGKESRVYARQITHRLLAERVLYSHASAEHRLLEALWDVGDFEALIKALQVVNDLAESDIVTIIKRGLLPPSTDNQPTLEEVLGIVADLPVSRAAFRQALKARLDAQDLKPAFVLLNQWLGSNSKQPLFDASTEKPRPAGEAVRRETSKAESASKPSLPGVLLLATDIFDTFFPILLSTPELHDHVSRLGRQVQAHLLTLSSLQILRAPLAAFARLDEDNQREAAAVASALSVRQRGDPDASEDELDAQVTSMRRAATSKELGGAAAIHPQATSQTGGGTMAKYGLPEKSRRFELKEESLSVGLYQLERLEL